MRQFSPLANPRATLSICAAFIAALICVDQRHVQIILSEPATYASPFHHRCGLLMIGCFVWALVESTLLRIAPRATR
jgi:hypothetical protein